MPVYMIRAGEHGPVKIGFSEDVPLRLVKMQADNHEGLTVLRMVEGGLAEEQALHQRFATSRLRGEWFSFSDEMLDDLGFADIPVPNPIALKAIALETMAITLGPVRTDGSVYEPDEIELRAKVAGLSVHDLCRGAGIAFSTFSRWRTGETSINIRHYGSFVDAIRAAGGAA